MSELFNKLLLELGEKIAQNSQDIADNVKEISNMCLDTSSCQNFCRINELIEANINLKNENRQFLLLQLKLRALLRNKNQSILLQIEEQSGFWIDEQTEHFILSEPQLLVDPVSADSDGTNLNGCKYSNANMPDNLIEQCVRDEKYEMCSILINSYSSKN